MFSTHEEYLNYIASENARNEHNDSIQCIRGATKLMCAKWENKTILLFGERHDLQGNEGKNSLCKDEVTFSIETRISFVNHVPRQIFELTGDVGISITVPRLLMTLSGKKNTEIDMYLEHDLYSTQKTRSLGESALGKLNIIFSTCYNVNIDKPCFLNKSTRIHAVDARLSDPIFSFIFHDLKGVSIAMRNNINIFQTDYGLQNILMDSVKLYNLLQQKYGADWEFSYFNDILESDNFEALMLPFLPFQFEKTKYFKTRNGKTVSLQKAQLLGLEADGKFELVRKLKNIAKQKVKASNIFKATWEFVENPSFETKLSFLKAYVAMTNNFILLMDIPGIARSLRQFGTARESDIICGFFGQKHTENWAKIYEELLGIVFSVKDATDACMWFDSNNENDRYVKECIFSLLQ